MLVHDHDPVRHFKRLVKFGYEHQCGAIGSGFADLAADVTAGADIDALEGFVEQQKPAFFREPAREHDLLLIAARKRVDPVSLALADHRQVPDHRVGGFALLCTTDKESHE